MLTLIKLPGSASWQQLQRWVRYRLISLMPTCERQSRAQYRPQRLQANLWVPVIYGINYYRVATLLGAYQKYFWLYNYPRNGLELEVAQEF